MTSYLVETCRGCLSTERASMMYSLCEEDTRRLFSNCTRLKITDDGTSLGQLCAQCYEFCENWFAFKSKCWMNDQGRSSGYDPMDDSYETGSEGEIDDFDEVTIESDRYGDEDFDFNESGDCSSPATALRTSGRERKSSSLRAPSAKHDLDVSKTPLDMDWNCVYCKKDHDSYYELRDHLKQHISTKKPHCRLCNTTFSRIHTATSHVLQYHMKKWDCPRCESRLNSFLEFDTHMEVAHQERGYGYLGPGGEAQLDEDWNCPVCNQQFNQYKTLRNHLFTHIRSSKKKACCPLCDYKRPQAYNIYPHILKVHMSKLNCRQCSAKFESLAGLNTHLLECHKKTGSNEKIAVKKMDVESGDDEGEGDEDEDTESEVSYQPPTKKSRKAPLRVTVKKESASAIKGRSVEAATPKTLIPNGNWDCLACTKKFTNYASLRNHLQSVHIKKKTPNCPVCFQRCSRPLNAVIHVMRQHMRKLDCPYCPQRLQSFVDFNLHLQTVHKAGGYTANKDRYLGREALAEETESDTEHGASPVDLSLLQWDKWDCPVCHKKFTRSSELRNHMNKEYLEVKNPTCPICGVRNSEQDNSFRHIITKHMKKYNCPYCQKKLGSANTFKIHLSESHQIAL